MTKKNPDGPGRGRPAKGKENRTARIDFRAQPSDKSRYERAAEQAGLSLADWINSRLDRAARRELGKEVDESDS